MPHQSGETAPCPLPDSPVEHPPPSQSRIPAQAPAGPDPEVQQDNFDRYQQDAARTLNPSLNAEDQLLDAAAGLAEEAGEVLALIRKHRYQNRSLNADQLCAELGDALWCLAAVATATNMSLGDVARQNIAKLRARHPHGFAPPDRTSPSQPDLTPRQADRA